MEARKHNERNAGRKPHGEEAKKHRSICIEKYLNDFAKKQNPNFSQYVSDLIKKELGRFHKKEMRKLGQ